MKLLSNALAVDLPPPQLAERSTNILFVGRLIPWKAPMLALRTLRALEHPSATLRFCGNGPEQSRLERAARNWGLEDRVTFEGWLPRSRLLDLVGTAGVLIHPAVHEEAGLCIAEALTLGTPVVCLDYGGPAEVVGHWPPRMYERVPPRTREQTARCMARAVDRFLEEPPKIPATAVSPRTSFREEILSAYDLAMKAGDLPSSTRAIRQEP